MRTSRSSSTASYTYVYNGGQLSKMTYSGLSDVTMYFTYDASGRPAVVTYDDVPYYYVTNLQGDVVAILNSTGTAVVQYTYDAWGKQLTTAGSMKNTLGLQNPLRYRGYVYDAELGLYYLQSRYYNPTIGRFLNADALISTGQGVLGNNMFAYCGNNPITFVDYTGTTYTPGQIHNFVVEDICGNNPNKEGKLTYMTYKQPYLNGKKYHLYGYCDVFDVETHEIWEVKRFGGGSSCSLAAATKQLRNYVANGVLNYFTPWEQYIGGKYTTIAANTFHRVDSDSKGIYVISYWDTGLGVIYYDYYYLPAPEELVIALAIAAGAFVLAGAMNCLRICLNADNWLRDC